MFSLLRIRAVVPGSGADESNGAVGAVNRGIQRVPGVQLFLHHEPARLTGRIVESRHVDLGDIPVTGQRQHWAWAATPLLGLSVIAFVPFAVA
ncbi:hypothetical protein [Streptomyces sp. NPDC001621]|uniref:hypothetical protein n=1 Tax=Streptomyces sp. NPDC001621 TaxID=3364594 RepID=UPI00368A7A09